MKRESLSIRLRKACYYGDCSLKDLLNEAASAIETPKQKISIPIWHRLSVDDNSGGSTEKVRCK
jgi:hypothetical protein